MALTHGLSISLAGKVRVNSISPGWIDTVKFQHPCGQLYDYSESDLLQHPAGRVGRPEDIAEMVILYHNDYGWKFKQDKN